MLALSLTAVEGRGLGRGCAGRGVRGDGVGEGRGCAGRGVRRDGVKITFSPFSLIVSLRFLERIFNFLSLFILLFLQQRRLVDQ